MYIMNSRYAAKFYQFPLPYHFFAHWQWDRMASPELSGWEAKIDILVLILDYI